MNNSYLPKKDDLRKVSLLPRFLGKFIDFFFIIILATFFYPLGILAGALYLILSDSLQGGQSIGKKVFGINVISLKTGKSCGFKESLTRNLPFLIPLIMAIVPIWGWILGGVIFFILSILECYLVVKLDSGHRLGDVMADTNVIQGHTKINVIEGASKSWFKD